MMENNTNDIRAVISYVLYVYNPDTRKYVYYNQVKYQAKIIKGECIFFNMDKYIVKEVIHDIDANDICLYLDKVDKISKT